MLQRLIRTDDDPSRLVLRLALGIVIFPHGAQKLFGWFGGPGLEGAIEGLGGVGVPPALAILVIVIEVFGALALIVGVLTRVAALGIAVDMIGAIVIVHGQFGFFMNWTGQQQGEGFEYHLLAIGIAVALMIGGAGLWSVDHALSRRR